MEYASEIDVLEYLENTLINGFSGDSAVHISSNPDEDITLISGYDETPYIIIELDSSESLENAVFGHTLSVITKYTISVISAKAEKKTYKENKRRNIDLTNKVREIFENASVGSVGKKKIDWLSVKFYDSILGNLPTMVSIITIATYNRNFDYQ